jgi:hypothetical protein
MRRHFRHPVAACVMALVFGLAAEARGFRPAGRSPRVGTRAFSRPSRAASGRTFRAVKAHKTPVKPSTRNLPSGGAFRRPCAGSRKSSVWFDVDRGKPGIIDNGDPGIIDDGDAGFKPGATAGTRPSMSGMDSETEVIELTRRRDLHNSTPREVWNYGR